MSDDIITARMGTLRAIAASSDRYENQSAATPGSVVGFLKQISGEGDTIVAEGSLDLPGGPRQGVLGTPVGGVETTRHADGWTLGPGLHNLTSLLSGDGGGSTSDAASEPTLGPTAEEIRRLVIATDDGLGMDQLVLWGVIGLGVLALAYAARGQ